MSAPPTLPWPSVLTHGLPKGVVTPDPLTERVLWWVGRAWGIGPGVLADLCGTTPRAVAEALRGLEEQELVQRRGKGQLQEAVALTNGGLRALARLAQLSPGRLAPLLGWRLSRTLWQQQGPTGCANRLRAYDAPVPRHLREVYALLGQIASESRAADLIFWEGPKLAHVWLEHELKRLMGGIGPYPDAGWVLWVRQHWLRYVVELELGSHRVNEAARKLRYYAWYAGSAACAATWEKPPILLFVTPDEGYETRLSQALAKEQKELEGGPLVLLTHQGLLEHARLLDAIWRSPGAGRVEPPERWTCWAREHPEFLLKKKEAEYVKRQRQKSRL